MQFYVLTQQEHGDTEFFNGFTFLNEVLKGSTESITLGTRQIKEMEKKELALTKPERHKGH